MPTSLIINTQFAALHQWNTIPDDHTQHYLKHPHRHMFHITLRIPVKHHDRDLEFIEIKNMLDDWLRATFPNRALANTPSIGSMSCEMLADKIKSDFSVYSIHPTYVCVMEDGENGAEVY